MFDQSDLISTYTRAQAIADGVLVDVTDTAQKAGIRYPVALTAAVWADCVAWDATDSERKQTAQDEAGRLWDVLWMFRQAVRGSSGNEMPFQLFRVPRSGQCVEAKRIMLKAIVGPGDDAEPVITILMPDED